MTRITYSLASLLVALTLTTSLQLAASDITPDKGKIVTDKKIVEGIGQSDYSPYAGRDFPNQVFWGDTHLHTAVSVDAGTMNRVGQEDAFRFARGEEVTTTHGLRARLSRPLDFMVLTDHAEMYGLMPQLLSGDRSILATEKGKRWYDMLMKGDPETTFEAAMEIISSLSKDEPPIDNPDAARKAWVAYTELADKYNEPGRFSAIIGYEWTAIGGYNLHRSSSAAGLESAPVVQHIDGGDSFEDDFEPGAVRYYQVRGASRCTHTSGAAR